jgi:glycosyltransferase involved in cell wall biosynthesis
MNPFLPEASYSGLGWDSLENGMSKATRKATYLIAGTEIGKQQVKNFYRVREDLIKVIPFPCYSLNKFDANYFNDKYSINRTELPKQYLFYPARFLPHKNHITLILALDILRKKYNTELNLVLVGRDNGNRRYVFDAIKRLGLEANVRHFGMVSSEDLVYLYKNAYALVYCSMNGPDNLPPLEAFTLGCPVIASKVIGATEQLGDAAILFETCDENDLATKIISLLNDETLRQSLIARGLKKAVGFSEKDYVSHVYDIFVEFSRIARAWERNDVRIEP